MIRNARVFGRQSTKIASLILLGAAVLAGSAAGAVVGLLGALAGASGRSLYGPVLLIAVLAGVLRQSRPFQLDRETPLSWLLYQDWRTAALNGSTLGLGLGTRLGFWLWYLVPIGAFLTGDVARGAIVFAAYSGSRIGVALLFASVTRTSEDWLPRMAYRSRHAVARLCDVALLAVAGVLLSTFAKKMI
jgi:hypothetical protein